ncbi:MarR family winged helix-turn-helix transcriptional regulator [Cryobacterium tepidiphilum]|uniref:MarR family transcriptional regulator n=1 Tax=Cryobacterium tepidiphilum TaxID=2486026 RepID=A0A3M8KWE1_9MICO|nr:MarR family transcriptional regulator [Cryobacterium tepidiphilum]RNE56628.1 MarR family transcriptional regulator [Cryobacterium tepidiphilum]
MPVIEQTDAETVAAIAAVEEQLGRLISHVRASMRDAATAMHPALQPFGLKLLRLLARCGPLHAGAAAEALMVDKSVISRQVRALEDLKLLELQPDPADGRVRILALTAFGKDELHRAHVKDKAMVHSRLSSWSAGDLNELASLLARLNSSVE